MKKIFLGLIAAGMLVACNQSNKTTQAASTPVTTTTESTAVATPVAKPLTHADSVNAPAMKFDKDTYNFGKIAQGDKVMHNFAFVNTGKTPLIISDATASCGCTKPEWPKEPIKPGDKGIIKVTFNSTGKQGLQDKLITITSNTVPTQTLVHLAGEVLAPATTK
jgi:hypothetical protein